MENEKVLRVTPLLENITEVSDEIEHEFIETKIGIRYTLSNHCKSIILTRLKELNGQYFQDESSQGLHSGLLKAKLLKKNLRKLSVTQDSFDFGNMSLLIERTPSSVISTAVIKYLKSHSGWHAKVDIIKATEITDGQWNTAIADLVDSGKVERHGERRGARYRAVNDDSAAL